jgi:hypothetical protein
VFLLATSSRILGACAKRPASDEEIKRVIVCLNMLVSMVVYALTAAAMRDILCKGNATLGSEMLSNREDDVNLV